VIFKEMDPAEVRKALEGHDFTLQDEVNKTMAYFAKLQCLYCGGSCRPVVNAEKPFEEGSVLPNYIAECNDCGAQASPYTRIEIKGPTRDPLADD
jgi:hypothetical protein